MSSHREAPGVSKDPVADSSDVYAFVSPDNPETVTLIANYVPLQAPGGGPNFYEFGDDVLYGIHVDNDGDGDRDLSFYFRFTSELAIPSTFLYNTGPIESLSSSNWNRRQFYSVYMMDEWGHPTTLGENLPCPPCNIGPLSTPSYAALAAAATHSLPGGITVFAGQRAEGFYVDLGAIFDLGDLRPFQQLHNQFGLSVPALKKPAAGVNSTKGVNVHTIALQVPKQRAQRQRRDADRPHQPGLGDRRLHDGQPSACTGAIQQWGRRRRRRALHAGVAVGQSADQRGHHPARPEGLLEHPEPLPGQAVRPVRRAARAGHPLERAVPGGLSQSGGLHQSPGPTWRRSC